MNENGRTYQQKLVWAQLMDGLKSLEAANDSLVARATNLVAASSGAIAMLTGIGILPKSIVSLHLFEAVIIILLCVTVLIMLWLVANLWAPRSSSILTSTDTDVLYDNYIAQNEDEAYNRALVSATKALEIEIAVNKKQGQTVMYLLRLVATQVAILVIGVLAKVFL